MTKLFDKHAPFDTDAASTNEEVDALLEKAEHEKSLREAATKYCPEHGTLLTSCADAEHTYCPEHGTLLTRWAGAEPTMLAKRPVGRPRNPRRDTPHASGLPRGQRPMGLANVPLERRKEIARLGGSKVSSDREHMRQIGRKGGRIVSTSEHMAEIGRKGGLSVSKDRERMRAIGKIGGSHRHRRTPRIVCAPCGKPIFTNFCADCGAPATLA